MIFVSPCPCCCVMTQEWTVVSPVMSFVLLVPKFSLRPDSCSSKTLAGGWINLYDGECVPLPPCSVCTCSKAWAPQSYTFVLALRPGDPNPELLSSCFLPSPHCARPGCDTLLPALLLIHKRPAMVKAAPEGNYGWFHEGFNRFSRV